VRRLPLVTGKSEGRPGGRGKGEEEGRKTASTAFRFPKKKCKKKKKKKGGRGGAPDLFSPSTRI